MWRDWDIFQMEWFMNLVKCIGIVPKILVRLLFIGTLILLFL